MVSPLSDLDLFVYLFVKSRTLDKEHICTPPCYRENELITEGRVFKLCSVLMPSSTIQNVHLQIYFNSERFNALLTIICRSEQFFKVVFVFYQGPAR